VFWGKRTPWDKKDHVYYSRRGRSTVGHALRGWGQCGQGRTQTEPNMDPRDWVTSRKGRIYFFAPLYHSTGFLFRGGESTCPQIT